MIGTDFLFQHDCDTTHTSKKTKKWLNENKINVLEWPKAASNIAPNENLFGIVKKQLHKKNYLTADDFKNRAKEIWLNLDKIILQNLADSLPR